jgi:hypothetical protein
MAHNIYKQLIFKLLLNLSYMLRRRKALIPEFDYKLLVVRNC